jgi:hypothetical protein
MSPSRGLSMCTSTWTLSFMPSARTMTFLCGKLSTSSWVIDFIFM